MSVSRNWVMAKILKTSGALVATVLLSLAAADGGDDFSNNPFSDMVPILPCWRTGRQKIRESIDGVG